MFSLLLIIAKYYFAMVHPDIELLLLVEKK